MLSLKLFGGASIEGEDGALLTGPAAHRHRLALVALLAAAHPGGLTRDKLLTYLWPERDTQHGRNLLNQAVHALRKALGEEAILSAGDELRFDPGAVSADVAEFEGALESGDLERAAERYAGPFLDGFCLPDAPEFERWMDGERQRFARSYATALEQLAAAAAARGDLPSAVEWWRRRAAEDPYNARVTVHLMEALEATGDRAGAIQQARVHGALLEREFGAEPDPEVVSLAERLRRATASRPTGADEGGASERDAEISVQPDTGNGTRAAPEAIPPGLAPPVPPATVRWVAWRSVALASLATLGIVTILALGWLLPEATPQPGAAPKARAESTRAIAVLPFENLTGSPEDAAFTNGIHSGLITALSGVRALTVISRASVLPYRDDSRQLPQIGAELGVDVLLEGSVQRLRDSVRVNVQLSDAESGEVLWAEGYERELTVGNIFAIQSEITERIVTSLEVSLTAEERERVARPPTESLTAYQYYHESGAVFNDTRAGNLEAERLLRLALAVDSGFAPAWAALADNYGWRPLYLGFPPTAWDSALVFVQRALAADPNLAYAYSALAVIYGHQGHLERSAHAAREALERDPDAALAIRRLAESYRERGAFVEALDHHLATVRLSPHHRTYRTWVGLTYANLGEHALAERWCRGVLAVKPDYLSALMHLAVLYLQSGQRDSAIAYADRLVVAHPEDTHALATAAMVGHILRDPERVKLHAGKAVDIAAGQPVRSVQTTLATTMLGFVQLEAGNRVRADSLFHESLTFLEGMVAAGATAPRWHYEIGLIHAARGEPEEALTWLHAAYDRGFRWAWMLEREPMLDPLRQDPRFQGLVARVRAEVEEMRRQVEQQERQAGSR